MTPDRWRKVCDLFDQACQLKGPDRSAFLTAIGQSDPELRNEVQALLDKDGEIPATAKRSPIDELLDAPSSDRQMKTTTRLPTKDTGSSDEDRLRIAVKTSPGSSGVPQIPDFRTIRLLGRGVFGQVWLAASLTGVHRAVKLLPFGPAREVEFEGIRAYQTYAADHPHLIQVFHIGTTPEWMYYVMELADGYPTAPTFSATTFEPRTLLSDLQRKGAIDAEEAARITRAVLSALAQLHGKGLLHRDVKPANIVFVNGAPKLADIGLLTFAARRFSEGHTPLYAPPEGVIDRSGDLYCLGKTLFQILTGRPPVDCQSLPDDLDPALRAAPEPLMPVIRRACAGEPARRFSTADQFLHALDELAPHTSVTVRSKRRLVPAMAAVGLLVAVAGAVWALLPRPQTGRLDVMVQAERFGNVPVSLSPEILPLRTADRIQVRLQLDPPAYPVVVMASNLGPPQPVYPKGDDRKRKLGELELPWLQLDPPNGSAETFTFIVFACSRPDGVPQEICEKLVSLGPAPALPSDRLVRWESGRLASLTKDMTASPGERGRGPRLDKSVAAETTMLDRLATAFDGDYRPVAAIAVPQAGQ